MMSNRNEKTKTRKKREKTGRTDAKREVRLRDLCIGNGPTRTKAIVNKTHVKRGKLLCAVKGIGPSAQTKT